MPGIIPIKDLIPGSGLSSSNRTGDILSSISSTEDQKDHKWILIQRDTFTRWVNEHLSKQGSFIADISRDFCDGIKLISLLEVLQGKSCCSKVQQRCPKDIQKLQNVQLALELMRTDGIKLVNIGNHDIVEGNMKLILGMVWCLILRYQIGGKAKAKISPRKLMLSWLRAVLPDLDITNFSTDWNDGVALSALLEYCQPGVFPDWASLDHRHSVENCSRALHLAYEHVGIPKIVTAEDLSSPSLDELSTMTYLSYFMKQYGAGYNATLRQVRQMLPAVDVQNFTADWNDGFVLCGIAQKLGVKIPNWPHINRERQHWINNLQLGLHGAKKSGAETVLSAQEMADPDVQHLAIMALAAHLCNCQAQILDVVDNGPSPAPSFKNGFSLPRIFVRFDASAVISVLERVDVEITAKNGHLISLSDLDVEVHDADAQLLPVHLAQKGKCGAIASFVVNDEGLHWLRVYYGGLEITNVPFRVAALNCATSFCPKMPTKPEVDSSAQMDTSKMSVSGLAEPCAVGSIVEVVITAHSSSDGQVIVEAHGPSGRVIKCPVHQKGTTYTATFTPNEVGEWRISIYYDSGHIKGSPFLCYCYDANLVQVYGLDVGVVGQELKFNVSTAGAGSGELKVNVLHNGRSIPCQIDRQDYGLYKVQFTPDGAGQYKIHIYFNNMEVKGSPFILDIVDASSVSVYGDNLRMASVGKLSTFMIHAIGADSKDLTVTIQAPSGRKKRARVHPVGDAAYRVEWKPVEAGEHYIDVRLYNQSVQDSPFTCNVGDPELVTVRNMPAQIRNTDLGEQHSFEIDASAAGSGNLEIMINNGRVPCKVKDLGGRCYLAAFIPSQPVTHVIELRFNGDPVKGSPWRIEVVLPSPEGVVSSGLKSSSSILGAPGSFMIQPLAAFASGAQLTYLPNFYGANQPLVNSTAGSYQTATTTTYSAQMVPNAGFDEVSREYTSISIPIEISGLGLKQACIGKMSSFEIGGKSLRSDDVEVKILSPTGKLTPCNVIVARTGNFRCEYLATDVGIYEAHILIQGKEIDGSPFAIAAFSPHKVFIEPIPGAVVGKPVQFVVDANEAGKGELEISVNQGRVPNNVQMQGPGRCLVTFIPDLPGTYVVDITFNGEVVRGCPLRVEIGDAASAAATYHRSDAPLSRQQPFTSTPTKYGPTPSAALQQENGNISSLLEPSSKPSSRSIYDTVEGTSPPLASQKTHPFVVNDRHTAYRTTSSELVNTGVATDSGKDRSFVSQTFKGSWSPDDTRNKEHTFTSAPPPPPGPPPPPMPEKSFLIHKSRNTDEEDRQAPERTVYRSELSYTSSSQMTPLTKSYTTPQRESPVTGHRLQQEKSSVFELPPSKLQPVSSLKSYEQQQYPSRTVTTTTYTSAAKGFEKNGQLLQEDSLRNGNLRTMDSRSQVSEQTRDEQRQEMMQDNVAEERTTQPEDAQILRYSSTENIVDATALDSVRSTEAVKQPQEARMTKEQLQKSAEVEQGKQKGKTLPEIVGPEKWVARVNQNFGFELASATLRKSDIDIAVTAPSKSMVPVELSQVRDGFRAEFKPTEIGTHKIHANISGQPLPDTPISVKVYDPDQIFVGDIEGATLQEPVKFTVDASNAGFGSLEIAIKDDEGAIVPSKVSQPNQQTARFFVSFVPKHRGLYEIHVSFNGETLKGSPFSCPIKDGGTQETTSEDEREGGVSEEELWAEIPKESRPPKLLAVGSVASFQVKASDGNKLHVEVKGPNGKLHKASIKDVGSSIYQVEYVPEIVGDHTVDVRIADLQANGSPFTCRVYDSKKIKVGNIPNGILGKSVHFVVDASEAGVGNLEVAVNEGRIPSMAQSLGQHRYDISFVPREEKDHTIGVKFNNEAVLGSPFTCSIVSSSQVVATGPGLERIPANRPTDFVVDPQGAPPAPLEINLRDPTGKALDVNISEEPSGGYVVEYTPEIVGNHVIEVLYANSAIAGSPFTSKVYDATKVKLHSVEGNVLGKPSSFLIDAAKAGAGNMEIIVSVDGRNVPNFVQPEGGAKFRVSFTPQEPKLHAISVKFNGEPVPGSPMECSIVDSSRCVASGEGLRQCVVSKPTFFIIDPRGAEAADCNVVVTAPSFENIPVKLSKRSQDSGALLAEYTPNETGVHHVIVSYGDIQLTGSPFACNVFDPSKVIVARLQQAYVMRPSQFTVDTSEAGYGELQVEVSHRTTGKLVNCEVTPNPSAVGIYSCNCVPEQLGSYQVRVFFNGVEVPGAEFNCEAASSSRCRVTGDGLRRAVVGQTATFQMEFTSSADIDKQIQLHIYEPDVDQTLPCSIRKRQRNMFVVQFMPRKVGCHEIEILLSDVPLPESPFLCEVFDPSAIHVLGLDEFIVAGREQCFKVEYANAGQGYLDVEIGRGSEKLKMSMEPLDDCSLVRFFPTRTGPYNISVEFNGHPISGSPFEFLVSDSRHIQLRGPGLTISQREIKTYFTVLTAAMGNGEIDVAVTVCELKIARKAKGILIVAPNGGAVPVKCFRQNDGNFRVEYTPTFIGEHKIDVTFADATIEGSPFSCEVVDCKRVVLGDIKNCIINQEASINVNRKDAGKGDLMVTLLDPKGDSVPLKMVGLSSGEEEFRFVPTKIGKHELQVTFAGFEVPNSPIFFVVDEPGKPTAHGDGLQRAMTNEPAIFIFEAKKPKGDLKVEISGPKTKVKPTIEKLENHWKVSYVPTERGKHEIKVFWSGKEISGSPFFVTVSDASKIRLSGQGELDSKSRLRLRVGVEKVLTVDAKDAGPGSLSSEVRGPAGKLPVQLEELSEGVYKLSFTPEVEGDHFVYLYWSDYPIPGTPSHAWAEQVDDRPEQHGKVQLKGTGLREARVGAEAEFLIDATRAAPGRPSCTITDIPISLSSIDENLWRASYTPLVPGKYSLHVAWNDQQVKGSPFKVLVEAEGDSRKVVVTGEGLKLGVIGKDIKSFIDTRRAGPGTLSAQCVGPNNRAHCEIYDHKDGTFTLNVKPEETGKHILTIKHGAEHVPGSPFNMYVSHPPDASKVKVYGPGIEHGILSKFKSNFIVETKGAGAGQLTVRMRGPKGAFNVVMNREHKHDRTIHCKYDPRETGDYQIEVKWAGEHVPGSPFSVIIVDTQMELERILSGQPPDMGAPHPLFLPPGWIGPPPPGIMLPPPMPGPPMTMHALPPPPAQMPPRGSLGPRSRDGQIPYATNTIYSNGSAKHHHWIASAGEY